MEVSYVLATEKPEFCANRVIKSILDLPYHSKEIILVSSNPVFAENKEVKFVLDDRSTGGVYAYNKGYIHAKGDWVINILDDTELPENFLDWTKEIESEDFKKLTIHAGQLIPYFWGPGKQIWHKQAQGYLGDSYPLNEAIPIDDPYQISHQSLNVPIILREDVYSYLGGVCWNTSFRHHYCDHWLGVYTEYINGCMSFFPKNVWLNQIVEFDRMTAKRGHDGYDIDILNKLRHKLYSEGCNYNYQI